MTHLSEELAGYSMKSLLGPGSEPIDRGVVNKTRKISAASFERFTNRRHGQDNVEIIGCFLDKV